MGAIDLTIDALLLDSDNPRIGSVASQRDALQRIIDDQGDKLFALAEDIVDEGLSPIDRLLVLRENPTSSRLIALEGNRRVAALKILANPHVLGDLEIKTALRKRLEGLSSRFNKDSVEPIAAFEVKTREEGRRWIYLRHTGENEGRGVVGWTGVAAARFRGEDPALQALEFVRMYGDLRSDELALLGQYFPITTLDRLLSAKEVRRRIGIEVVKNKLSTGLPAAETIKPLRKIVLDLAHKRVNVSQLKNQQQQVAYIESLPKEDVPDLSKVGPGRPIEAIRTAEFGSKPSKKQKTHTTGERRTVAPKKAKLNVTDAKTARILRELQSINAEETPNAGAVLLRVFLELSVDSYLDQKGIPLQVKTAAGKTVDKSLKAKVDETIQDLVNAGAKRKDFLSVTRGLSVASSPFSIDLLHAYVHNRFVTPKGRELLAAWDDATPLFEGIWP